MSPLRRRAYSCERRFAFSAAQAGKRDSISARSSASTFSLCARYSAALFTCSSHERWVVGLVFDGLWAQQADARSDEWSLAGWRFDAGGARRLGLLNTGKRLGHVAAQCVCAMKEFDGTH